MELSSKNESAQQRTEIPSEGTPKKTNEVTSEKTDKEIHVAIFGQSGSGKTVLLSTFYGHHRSRSFRKSAKYFLNAVDSTPGDELLRNYHRLMKYGETPKATAFKPSQYAFKVYPAGSNQMKKAPIRVVWHDYPGEWWTETKTEDENNRKIATFKALLRSNVAFLLVDGQKLLDHSEGHYMPYFFSAVKDELMRQQESILEGKEHLQEFPRIWTICLSKADLFPDKDVEWFRDEVLASSLDQIQDLRETIQSMVAEPSKVSLGDDFLLLSSAKFDPTQKGKVLDPQQTTGIDLIVPIATYLPFQHEQKWANAKSIAIGWVGKALDFVFDRLPNFVTGRLKWVAHTVPLLNSGIDVLRGVREKAIKDKKAIDAVLLSFEIRILEEQKKPRQIYWGEMFDRQTNITNKHLEVK